MRFREHNPEDLARARAVVAARRAGHPAGAGEELMTALAFLVHRDYAPVLRGTVRGRPAPVPPDHRLGAAVAVIRSGLRLIPDELDQFVRLVRFQKRHPDVIVGDGGFGTMQARIPETDGETVITRYTLRELLDKLDELLP